MEKIYNFKLYNAIQVVTMKIYIETLRKYGDERSENEICIEWIKLYSADFRKTWSKEECIK